MVSPLFVLLIVAAIATCALYFLLDDSHHTLIITSLVSVCVAGGVYLIQNGTPGNEHIQHAFKYDTGANVRSRFPKFPDPHDYDYRDLSLGWRDPPPRHQQDHIDMILINQAFNNDYDVVLEAVRSNSRSLEFASDFLKDNKYIVLAAVESEPKSTKSESELCKYLTIVPRFSKSKYPGLSKKISELRRWDKFPLKFASDRLRDDRETISLAMRTTPRSFIYASKRLKDDKNLLIQAIKSGCGDCFAHASDKLRDDKDIVLDSALYNRHSFQYASDRLRDDYDTASQIIGISPQAFQYASERLRNTKSFVLEILGSSKFDLPLRGNDCCLEYISDSLKDDIDVVSAVVQKYPTCIKYASERLMVHPKFTDALEDLYFQYYPKSRRNDKVLVMSLLTSGKDHVFRYTSDRLKDDMDVVMLAVECDGKNLEYVSVRLKDDRDVVVHALINGASLKHASERLKGDKGVVTMAVNKDLWAVLLASDTLKSDSAFLANELRKRLRTWSKHMPYHILIGRHGEIFIAKHIGSEVQIYYTSYSGFWRGQRDGLDIGNLDDCIFWMDYRRAYTRDRSVLITKNVPSVIFKNVADVYTGYDINPGNTWHELDYVSNTMVIVRDSGQVCILPENMTAQGISAKDIVGHVSPIGIAYGQDESCPLTITKDYVYDWHNHSKRTIDKTVFSDIFIQKLLTVRSPRDITDVDFAGVIFNFMGLFYLPYEL
jgi:hypothetical protein